MGFLSVLICLLVDYFSASLTIFREVEWFTHFRQAIQIKLASQSPLTQLMVLYLPFIFIVFVVQIVFSGVLFNLLSLVFDLLVLFFCLRRLNVKESLDEMKEILDEKSVEHASIFMEQKYGVFPSVNENNLYRAVNTWLVQEYMQGFFVVIFWFFLLGPVGAVVSRLLMITSQKLEETESQLWHINQKILSYVEWLPSRVVAISFSLVGQFDAALDEWLQHWKTTTLQKNHSLVFQCVHAALGMEEDTLKAGSTESVRQLLVRTQVLWLGVVGGVVLLYFI
jgi:AmpE protein